MSKQKDILIAIYGLQQAALKREGLLDGNAVPIGKKHLHQDDVDAFDLYKWLAEQLIEAPESTLESRKVVFNNIVNSLEKEYLLNIYLMSLFMLEMYLEQFGHTAQKIVLMPKINRLIEFFRKGIISDEENGGFRIVKDSKIGASNVIRRFNGEAELTKKVRSLNAEKWRNVAKSAKKDG